MTKILAVQRKCTKLPAQIVVMNVKFLLSQKKADLFIAGIVIKNIENFRFYTSRFSDLFFFFFYSFSLLINKYFLNNPIDIKITPQIYPIEFSVYIYFIANPLLRIWLLCNNEAIYYTRFLFLHKTL